MAKVVLRTKKNSGSISPPDFMILYRATGVVLAPNQTGTELD